MRKILFAAVLGLALSACGGGGGGGGGISYRDPDQASFNYGSDQTPSLTEQDAASAAGVNAVASTGLAEQAGTSSAPDASYAQAKDPMAGAGDVLPGGLPFGTARAAALADATVAQRAAAFLQGDLAAATMEWTPGCWTASSTEIRFTGCVLQLDPALTDGLAGTITLDGAFALSAGLVSWDVTATAHMTGTGDGGQSFTMDASERLRGNLAYTATTLSGRSRADVSMSASSGAQYAALAVTLNTDYALTYAAADVCTTRVTGGTLTLKRLWAQVPDGANGDPMFTDASARFTWTGCGAVTIAKSW